MSSDLYAVVFTAKLSQGISQQHAQSQVARLFKVEPEKVAHLFTGKKVVVKKSLDGASAKKYQQALLKAGLVCTLINQTQAAKKQQAQSATPATPQATTQNTTTVETDTTLVRSVVKQPPENLAALDELEMSSNWDRLEPEHYDAPPEINIDGVDLADKNDLPEPEDVAELEVDTEHLNLDAPGTVLVEAEEIPPLEVDTSMLSVEQPKLGKAKFI